MMTVQNLQKMYLFSKVDKGKFALSDEEILQLAHWACLIEDHYSQVHGIYTPMDIEWAKDGITNQLFVVQARPETVQSQKKGNVLRSYRLHWGLGMGMGMGKKLSTPTSDSLIPWLRDAPLGKPLVKGKANLILDVT